MVHTVKAGHRSGDRQGYIRGIRAILSDLEDWLENGEGQCVFRLDGLGTSVIAQTFTEITFAEGKLGASFFCSQGFEERSNVRLIFPALVFQLTYRYPLF